MDRGFRWAPGARVVACALTVGTVGTATGAATPARADVPVAWDCFLPDAQVECSAAGAAFFPSVPGLAQASEEDARVTIELRSIAVPSGRRYVARFEGRPVGAEASDAEPVRFALLERVPDSAGSDRTLMRLVAMLQRGTVPFLRVVTPGEAQDGVLRLEAAAVEPSARGPGEADDARTGWYLRPTLEGELVSAGVRVTSLGGGLELSHSTPTLRWLASGSAGYRHLDVTLPSGRLRGGFVQARGSSTLAHSLGSGFSAAILGGARREPQNNLELRGDAGVGLEWVHRDFLRADEGNVGARYRLQAVWDRYATETVHGQHRRLYPRQSLGLFARWHLDDVDVEADVGGGVITDQPELWDVGGELSLTLRLAAGLELSLSGALIYRGGAVHEPADPGRLDPVASIVSGSDFGRLTYTTGVSLAYSFGNGLLRAQDQRWR